LPARAGDTLVVQNCNDSGPGSLRQALLDAAAGDTVDLRALDCPAITPAAGELVVLATPLMLVGPGQDLLAIDAGGHSRALQQASAGELTIADLTIRNGTTHEGSGGCIQSQGSLVLVRSTVTGCVADDPAVGFAEGGGISVRGNLVLQSSALTANTASAERSARGGGVSSEGTVYLDGGSRIAGNVASGGNSNGYTYGAFGGGVQADSVVMEGTAEVSGNRATSGSMEAQGGGIHTGWLTIGPGGRLSGNSASGQRETWGGGAVALDALISGASITDNQAQSSGGSASGGALFGLHCEYKITNSTLSGNLVEARRSAMGGAIRCGTASPVDSAAHLQLTGSSLVANEVHSSCDDCNVFGGGAIALSMDIDASSISNNRISAIGAQAHVRGGGLATLTYIPDREVHVRNSTLSGNTAGDADALHAYGGAISTLGTPLFLANSTIAFNSAHKAGGGIALDSAQGGEIVSSIVAMNVAFTGADIATLDGTAVVIPGGHDLVGNAAPGVAMPDDTLGGDPLLLDLACNGGATATHALAPGSPAIDAGSNPAAVPYDQRGAPWVREAGTSADIGAFEQQAEPGVIFHDGFEWVADCY
jgi:cytoskeletal protein CcmA (bactofilin family)